MNPYIYPYDEHGNMIQQIVIEEYKSQKEEEEKNKEYVLNQLYNASL